MRSSPRSIRSSSPTIAPRTRLASTIRTLDVCSTSWVPIARWFVPDQKQHLRIRLKIALVDVRSGDWTVFTPRAFDDSRLSTRPRRGIADQKLVERLKDRAYEASARELMKSYAAAELSSKFTNE